MSLVRDARDEFAPPRSRRWWSTALCYQNLSPLVATFDFVWIVATSIGSGTAYHLVAVGGLGDFIHYLGCGVVVAALFCLSARAYDLYRPSNLIQARPKTKEALFIWTMVFLCLATVAFTLKISDVFSRGAVLLFFAAGFVVVISSRIGIACALRRMISRGTLGGRRVALLLKTDCQRSQSDIAAAFKRYGYSVPRVFDVTCNGSDHEYLSKVAERVRDIVHYLRNRQVDEVVLALPWNDVALIDAVSDGLRMLPVPIRLIPDPQIGSLLERPILDLGPAKAIELQRAPLTNVQLAIKRATDIVLAGLGLVLLAPVFAAIATTIRLDSAGPILFVQVRVGFNGRHFRIYKFRTMVTLEDGPIIRQACRGDPRVTRVGRILRRFSLDELPQLLNVLRGEMSLVGPRPHALAHDSEYDKLIASYAVRKKMKPGLTGLAQVNGYRGETREVYMMKRRVEHDLRYIDCWSLWLDLRIVARTLRQLVRPKDVY
jgi:Undecaprenyl-phosphate glucose phosphotransferase